MTIEQHIHTDACWEPDSGCDMGRNEKYAARVPMEECLDCMSGEGPCLKHGGAACGFKMHNHYPCQKHKGHSGAHEWKPEPLSSKPTVIRYDVTTKPYHYGASMERDELGEWVRWEDYERLTAELQGTKDELYSVDKAAKELGAERDRLATDLARLQTEAHEHYQPQIDESIAEINRLRAALDIARAALAEVIRTPRDEYKQPSETQAIPCESSQEHRAQPVETTAAHKHDWLPSAYGEDACFCGARRLSKNGEGSL